MSVLRRGFRGRERRIKWLAGGSEGYIATDSEKSLYDERIQRFEPLARIKMPSRTNLDDDHDVRYSGSESRFL